jgi:hypothetical protein
LFVTTAQQLVGLVEDLAGGRERTALRRPGPGLPRRAAVDVDDEPSLARVERRELARHAPRRRSRVSRCSPLCSSPRARRSLLRRSMMTFTFGSSL